MKRQGALNHMPRPKRCRRIAGPLERVVFKPAGVPTSTLPEVVLELDELEAIRLADFEGLYQEQAAERMNVSRQTFGRIVATARKKVAQVLVEGQSLRIEGGSVEVPEIRTFACRGCQHTWQLPYGTGRPGECPECTDGDITRAEPQQGSGDTGRGRGRRRGTGQPQ
jgi:uncharacterized protein